MKRAIICHVFLTLVLTIINSSVLNAQTLLQDYQNGINAIIDTQEKNRTRIADDLHDNVGSKIATLNLYIEEIRTQENSAPEEKMELNSKLKSLADETYKEVRKIAHNKSFGALINKGIIPSIKEIANQISIINILKIEVININVNEYLKNSVEIHKFKLLK